MLGLERAVDVFFGRSVCFRLQKRAVHHIFVGSLLDRCPSVDVLCILKIEWFDLLDWPIYLLHQSTGVNLSMTAGSPGASTRTATHHDHQYHPVANHRANPYCDWVRSKLGSNGPVSVMQILDIPFDKCKWVLLPFTS